MGLIELWDLTNQVASLSHSLFFSPPRTSPSLQHSLLINSSTMTDDLEKQRQELEKNIQRLQESLYRWRLWEAEYDGLREEINSLDDDEPSRDDYFQAARNFGGTLADDEKQLDSLLRGGKSNNGSSSLSLRSKRQVDNVLSRRIDYTQQNVASLEKMLRAAEDKLDSVDMGLSQQAANTGDHQNGKKVDGGGDLPAIEIFEQLDDQDRVISGSTSTPGSKAPELLEILKKVGVENIPDHHTRNDGQRVIDLDNDGGVMGQDASPVEVDTKDADGKVDNVLLHDGPDGGSHQSTSNDDGFEQEAAQYREAIIRDDESPKDAKLRREMLDYSLKHGLLDNGAVVAELELDEDGDDMSIDDDDDDDDDDDEAGSYYGDGSEDSDNDEHDYGEEDEYGRSTGPILTSEYHERMRELERRLNARGMWNVGKDTRSPAADAVHDGLESSGGSMPASQKKKGKKVSFAQDLDIAPSSSSSSPPPPTPTPSQSTLPTDMRKLARDEPIVPVVSDSVVERSGQEEVGEGKSNTAEMAPPPKRMSRFKSARVGQNK